MGEATKAHQIKLLQLWGGKDDEGQILNDLSSRLSAILIWDFAAIVRW